MNALIGYYNCLNIQRPPNSKLQSNRRFRDEVGAKYVKCLLVGNFGKRLVYQRMKTTKNQKFNSISTIVCKKYQQFIRILWQTFNAEINMYTPLLMIITRLRQHLFIACVEFPGCYFGPNNTGMYRFNPIAKIV